MMEAKKENRILNMWETIKTPSKFFDFSWKSKKGILLLIFWIAFLALWFISNLFWKFPWFGLFCSAFVTIHAISFGTLKYFFQRMTILNENLAGCNFFIKARYFYRNTDTSSINIWFPLIFILLFGIGGCVLYTTARPTLTFILYMIYFVVMVYFSMIIYLQYIRFCWYIRLIAKDCASLSRQVYPVMPNNKLKVQWLQDLTDIACAMRYMFASVGMLYIAAFALFCFSPAFGASITAPIFYFLWAIITIFVVIIFIIVNNLNSFYLDKLRDKIKQTYVEELISFDNVSNNKENTELFDLTALFRQICAISILNSNDFPTKNAQNWILSAGITTIQVVASVATLFQFQAP